MSDSMDDIRKRRTLRALADIDMVEMKPTGRWGLTEAGRSFLDQLDVLRSLDDRPDAEGGQQSRAVKRSKGARPGDDGRSARRAPGKGTQ